MQVVATDGALGLRFYRLRLTNCGRATYRLNGYPKLKLLDQDRHPIAIAVRHGTADLGIIDPGPTALTVRPGHSADTILTWRNTLLADGTEPLASTYADIVAKPGTAAQTIPVAADTGTTRLVHVTAWQPQDHGS